MAKFLIVQDCTAEGTNITPYGSEIPNFLLTYHFHQGETVEGTIEEEVLPVNTTSGTRADGSIYNGDCVFYIPVQFVQLIDSEELPPLPAEENALPPSVPAEVEQPATSSQLVDIQSVEPVVEPAVKSVKIKNTKKKNEEFLILGAFLLLLLTVILRVILSKC